MPSSTGYRVVLTDLAQEDVVDVLKWSHQNFGEAAAHRYRRLLLQAFQDLAANPERPGSTPRPELDADVRTFHLNYSRKRARGEWGVVRRPRHFVIYRKRNDQIVEVIRVLHDARELSRHLP